MERINFEDGQLVKEGYVEIDGVQYPITEAEYSGDTPLSAYIMNKLQDNIEESAVIVSTTEPTTGEKVWLKKRGKNLFNKNDIKALEAYINASGTSAGISSSNYSIYIECKPNTTYAISSTVAIPRFRACSYPKVFRASDGVAVNGAANDGGTSIIITTTSNDKFLFVNITDYTYLDGLQIEEGSEVTDYEEYEGNTIYILNENGEYEKFMEV